MSTYIKQKRHKETSVLSYNIPIILLSVLILVTFLKPDMSNISGPALAVAFVAFFFMGYHEFVFAAIITANDALGTIFMGQVSFQYLLLALAVIKILQSRSISKRRWLYLFVSAYFLIQLILVESVSNKGFINASSYTIAIIAMSLDTDDKTLSRFLEGVAIIVVAISIHAAITGGVKFYEFSEYKDGASEHFLRRGILGTGSGNPNFSAFLLNIGLIALWHFASWNILIRLLCSLPILYAFILTNSLSGLFALLFITILSILLQQDKNSKIGKRIFIVCLVVLILIGLLGVYSSLPSNLHIKQLDNYLLRIENRLSFAHNGEWNSVTTNRSHLATRYINYIFRGQNFVRLLFGGNPLIVPSVSGAIAHNNYIGLLLQIGVVGTLIFLIVVIKRLFSVWKQPDMPYRKGRILLKVFCMFASFGISLYGNALWGFWMMSLLLL